MRKINYFIIALLFTACLPIDKRYPIWIKNNSDRPIYLIITNKYPDTTLLTYINIKPSKLDAGSKTSHDSNEPWEEVFTANYPKDTLLIYFFNSDTINKYSWETICTNYKIIEKRAYSKVDLQRNDWTITYP